MSRMTLLPATSLPDISFAALHSMMSPSISRVATNSRTCDTTTPPYEPGFDIGGVLFAIWVPFLYQFITDCGLEESVSQVNVTLLIVFANTVVLPLMVVCRGLTKDVNYLNKLESTNETNSYVLIT